MASHPRYELRGILGEGRTGTVRRATRTFDGRVVAIKLFEGLPKDAGCLEVEREVYRRVMRSGDDRRRTFLDLLDEADEGPKRFIVFQCAGPTLAKVIARPGPCPLPRGVFEAIQEQLLAGIAFLHGLSVIHTDIKPENVLLENENLTRLLELHDNSCPASHLKVADVRPPRVFIIDFEDALVDDDFGHAAIGSSAYRAPEVTMALEWGPQVDLFGLGCVFAELHLGQKLFPQSSSPAMRFAALQRVLGPLPRNLVYRTGDRFARELRQASDSTYIVTVARRGWKDAAEYQDVLRLRALEDIIDDAHVLRLCQRLLSLDPDQRNVGEVGM